MKKYTDELSFILKPSTIPGDGVGVFLLHDIYTDVKLAVIPDEGESRPLHKKEVPPGLIGYCIGLENGLYKCPLDFRHMWIGWYMNHSDNPNAELREGDGYYSIRPIRSGEEILIDYRTLKEPPHGRESFYR